MPLLFIKKRQDFHILYLFSFRQDLLHDTIVFDLVTVHLNFDSLNVADKFWLLHGKFCCILTTLVTDKAVLPVSSSPRGHHGNLPEVPAPFDDH